MFRLPVPGFRMCATVLVLSGCGGARLQKENEALQAKLGEREEQVAKLEASRQAAVDEAAALKKSVEDLRQSSDALTREVEAGREKYKALEEESARLSSRHAAAVAELRQVVETIEQTRKEVEKLQQEIEDLTKELERLRFLQRSSEEPEGK